MLGPSLDKRTTRLISSLPIVIAEMHVYFDVTAVWENKYSPKWNAARPVLNSPTNTK